MKAKFIFKSLLITLITINADAQTVPQNNRAERIRQGVRSGEITRGEAARLREGQRDIREEKREARADGVVTPGERREVRQEVRQQNRRIYRVKHNARDRN
jgi:hypothetical protein